MSVLFGIRLEIEVETDIFRAFFVEVRGDSIVDVIVDVGDALRGDVAFAVDSLDKRRNVTDFDFDASIVTVFLGSSARAEGGGALELTESFADGFVAATEDPINDFAFAHNKEVFFGEVTANDHRVDDVGDELKADASLVIAAGGKERKGLFDEVGADLRGLEAELVKLGFVLEDGDVVVKSFDLIKGPDAKNEEAVREGVLEAIGGEIRNGVVGDRVEVIIGNFAGEDAVFFELTHNGTRIANDLASAIFERFLSLSVAIHKIDAMLKSRRGNIVEKTGEGLFFVVGEFPDNERYANTVLEDGIVSREAIESGVINANHADAVEALELRGGNVFEQPSGELWREGLEILASFGSEVAEALSFAGEKVDVFVATARE